MQGINNLNKNKQITIYEEETAKGRTSSGTKWIRDRSGDIG